MNYHTLANSDLSSSRLIYGCMRICGDGSEADRKIGRTALRTALDAGFNHFDHADIYAHGESERLFGEILNETSGLRDKIIITSKCGIRFSGEPNPQSPKRYDFSKEHIIQSVEGSLKRLKTDYLDILLLHRPDYLMDPGEVAAAFDQLYDSGMVKYFGVSNFRPSQVDLLKQFINQNLIVNQLEINLHNLNAFHSGALDQCQTNNICPQAWSPLKGIVYSNYGQSFTPETEKRVQEELKIQSQKYNAPPWIIGLAWLLKHPSKIYPIVGSIEPKRIQTAKLALTLDYSREDWYRLLESRIGNTVP